MSRWTPIQLAEALAKNPNVRISRSERLQPLRAEQIAEGYRAIAADLKTFPTKTKYGNEPTVFDGERYDSKKEMRRGLDLKLMERAGQIKHLERQVSISLDINGVHICKYVADFKYQEKQADGTWRIVIEDVKGMRTRLYIIKKNLVRALMGIEIRET